MFDVHHKHRRLTNGSHDVGVYSLVLETDSRSSGTVYTPQWAINIPHFNNLDKYYLQISQIQFMNLVYPTNEFNNALSIKVDGGAQQTVLMPEGMYTSTTLLSALDTLLTIAPITVTTSYDSTTGKLSFAVSGGTLEFLDGIPYTMYKQLGLEVENFSGAFTSLTGDYPIDISGSKHVVVTSNIRVAHNYHSKSQRQGHLTLMPLEYAFGVMHHYEGHTSPWFYVQSAGVHTLELTLRDDAGNYFKLPANVNMCVTVNVRGASMLLDDEDLENERDIF